MRNSKPHQHLPQEDREAYSVGEVAHKFGVAPNTVYAAVYRGEIEATQVGRRVLISRAVLERLLCR
jgi:excisionase family DNA binding protein